MKKTIKQQIDDVENKLNLILKNTDEETYKAILKSSYTLNEYDRLSRIYEDNTLELEKRLTSNMLRTVNSILTDKIFELGIKK